MNQLAQQAVAVVKDPAAFYRTMPKEGGYSDPFVFTLVLSALSGLIHAVLLAAGMGPTRGLIFAFATFVLTPVIVCIGGFIGAFFFHLLWKQLGSQESYETAYRCGAYAMAIAPLTALLGVIPFIGAALGTAWMAVLMIAASVETHKIRPGLAKGGFGGIAAFFCLLSISGQFASRAMKAQVMAMAAQNQGVIDDMARQMKASQAQMTPEQRQAMDTVMAQLQEAAKNGRK